MQPLQGSLLHGTALSGLQPAWPSLQPQRRRPELAPACSTRRPLINVVAPESRSTVPAAGGTSPPPPHQQHAQPPHAGSQQLGQSDGSREGEFLNILRKARPPPRQQRAAPPRRPGSPNSGDGSSGSGSSSSSSRAPASAAAVTGTPAPSTPAAAKLAPAAGDSTAAAPAPPPASEAGVGKEDTEVIFRLERRGDGWAEEILPHLVVEQRPLKKKKRAYSRPDPWKEGSLECYLVDCGVPADDVDRVVTQAVAWRVTPGGRFLIDRRRRSRVERNVRLVVEHLEVECGVPPGPGGVAAILARCPEIMLCKPTTNDRWDRRAVELSAYLLRNGHCNVPEDWEESIELGLWVKRQRISRAAGQLSEERLSILQSMDFAFGEVAQMTEEWEHRFDQLVDWIIWHNENQQPFSWLGSDWGARGGITARELALWTTLQREYRARGLLPAEALSRFDAIGMLWDAPDGAPADRQWMAWFGRLLYLIERHNVMQPTRHHFLGRSLRGRPKGARTNGGGSVNGGLPEGEQPSDSSDEEEEQREGEGGEAGTEHGKVLSGGGRRRGEGAAVSAARQRLQAEMLARRSALAAADLRSEPGLRFWIARQLRRWRAQQLPGELALMLQLAGVQLDPYTPVQWQALAHSAAALLQGSQITLDPRTQQQLLAQQRRPAAAAAAAAGTNGGRLPLPAGQSEAPARTAVAVAEQSGGSKLATLSAALDGKQQQLQQQQQQQQQVDMECVPGSTRLRAARWVQTQQALFAEGKLSGGQLRYMAFLGITWVLSEEVYGMSEGQWLEWCGRLADAPRPLQRGSELWEWLQHQRGLHALGWLPLRRIRALAPLQVRLDSFDRCASEDAWDRQLSKLLAFKAEHRHCRLLLAAGPAAAAAAQAPAWIQDEQQRQRWVPLAAWLAEQHRLLAANRLSLQQATQLAAIGAVPPPVKAAQP